MNYYIKIPCLSLERTLESGQCFRWRREESDGGEVIYCGIAGTRAARIRQEPDGITVLNAGESELPEAVRFGERAKREDFAARPESPTFGGLSSELPEAVRFGERAKRENFAARPESPTFGGLSSELPEAVRFWERYFDAETDYEAILNRFSEDGILRCAVSENRGLRILRQEPFETLITFILSQNNNIPRIRGLVERLCAAFGEPNGSGYGFPTAERLARAEPSELEPIRAGFRTRYITDAAKKVAAGTVDLSEVGRADYETGKAMLRGIVGVGEKVADCVLLFAYHKTEAFPSDVWIKRVMAEYYKNGLPECAAEEKGIAQQYLFEYFRKKTK